MRVYFDVCCLNRPFDDHSAIRVRREAEAVKRILEWVEVGRYVQVASDMSVLEIDAIRDVGRRSRVKLLLPQPQNIVKLGDEIRTRATSLAELGFAGADAVHLAAAEQLSADVLLTCDDRLFRVARRRSKWLRVEVANPVDWINDHETRIIH